MQFGDPSGGVIVDGLDGGELPVVDDVLGWRVEALGVANSKDQLDRVDGASVAGNGLQSREELLDPRASFHITTNAVRSLEFGAVTTCQTEIAMTGDGRLHTPVRRG